MYKIENATGKTQYKNDFLSSFRLAYFFAVFLDVRGSERKLCVLKKTVTMRRFYWTPKTSVKTDGQENDVQSFMLKLHVFYL